VLVRPRSRRSMSLRRACNIEIEPQVPIKNE
jgi:hypothetical protein